MACRFLWLEILNMGEIASVLKYLVVYCVGHSPYNFNLCISFFILELQCVHRVSISTMLESGWKLGI